MTIEEVQKIINILVSADEGNEVVMLELLNNFIRTFPEHASLARLKWTEETGKEFKQR